MKREIWLHNNQRFYALLALLVASIGIGCGLFMAYVDNTLAFWTAAIGVAVCTIGLLILARKALEPRLAYRHGTLAVYLQAWQPILVPIDIVECFFLGQRTSGLPNLQLGDSAGEVATKAVVVRIAESAHEWQHRSVRPSLGHWCEGYITILGTWCEPLGSEVVARLNRRLVEVQRELRQGNPT